MSVLLRRCVFAVVVLGAVALSGLARAQTQVVGLNLSWGDCGANGVLNEDFACNSNAGTHLLVGSFITPPGVTALTGQAAWLDMITAGSAMPAWWTFPPFAGSCRTASSFAGAYPGGTVGGACANYFGDNNCQGAHVHDYPSPAQGSSLPQTMRIRTVAAIDAGLAGPVTAGEEQYALSFTINNQRTVGTTVCAGCDVAMCFVFNGLFLSQPVGVGDFVVSGAPVGGRDFVTWQGGSGANCTLVPVKNSTWGQIKSLYR